MYSKRDGTGGPFEPGPLKVSSTGRVTEAMTHLGPRALQLLADIAERLAKGAKQYGGDFDDKPRDWVQETLEETADGLVYASMKLLEVREAKAADEARNRAARRLSDAYTPMITQEPTDLARREYMIRVQGSDPRNWESVNRMAAAPPSHEYGQNREPLGPAFYKHYGPPTERDGVWAACSSKSPIREGIEGKTWPLNTPGEDWEKTRAGCG